MKIFYPNSKTRKFGILGYPLSHTLSPIMHNFLYSEQKINALYQVFEIESPSKGDILTLQKFGIEGLSVTIPHKEWAYQIADKRDASAEIMKSANTLFMKKDGIYAFNTDGIGAIQAINRFQPSLLNKAKPGDILILGSGGSARGIGFAILQEFQKSKENISSSLKKHIILSARNHEKGIQLMDEMNSFFPNSTLFIPLEEMQKNQATYVDLVIHTTNVGMLGGENISLLPKSSLNSNMTIFDIVYNPPKTELVKIGKSLGCKIIPGIDMLIYQGLEQHKIFTGMGIDDSVTKKIRKKLLKKISG